jgi:hypothetical protein
MSASEPTSTPEQPARAPMTPLIAFFSRYGIMVLGVLILIELAFHAYAVRSAKKRDAAGPPPSAISLVTSRLCARVA